MTDYYSNLLLESSRTGNLTDAKLAWMKAENRYETDFLGHNALTLSILHENFEVFQYLVDAGINLNLVNNVIETYNNCCSSRKYQYLKEYNGNDSFLSATALICATKKRNFDMVQYLFERGASLNIVDPENHIALYYSILKRCNIEMIEYFIRNESDIETTRRQLDEYSKFYKNFDSYWNNLKIQLEI